MAKNKKRGGDEDSGEDKGGDVELISRIMVQVAGALDAESVAVKLQSGATVSGTLAGFSVRKRKGNVSGKLSIEIETGVLEIDCETVQSVSTD